MTAWRGLFYAGISLWQLLSAAPPEAGVRRIANGIIVDHPRFRWRGLMLDSVRHMQSVATIKTVLEQMAEHKLNVFHWHLTDDQGWRLPVDGYPELTRIGAWRKDGNGKRYGGFYTRAQIREIVAYAAERHIMVIPEIDMPGHAQAAVASYPWAGVTGRRPPVSQDWGVNPYLFNIDARTFKLIHAVLDEVMALFPSRYIHAGGDEAIKDQWQASPTIRKRLHQLGLDDADALQAWFMHRISNYLAQHGRRMLGWDEILDGGAPDNAVVMSWRGGKGAVKAASQGHDVVMAPSGELYFDHVQSSRSDEISGRLPVISLADVYAYDPAPPALDARARKHVLGAQANVWTEHLPGAGHVLRAIFPRIDALAEVLWSPPSKRNWDDFLQRLSPQLGRYAAGNVAWSDSAFAVDITVDRAHALASGSARVMLSNQAGFGTIRYTLDGSTPNSQSPRYTGPFPVTLPTTVAALALDDHGKPLSHPRQRVLSHAALLSLSGNTLPNCPGSDFRLRVQPAANATSLAPDYSVNVFDACQMYPPTALDGVGAIRIDVARLPRNYALAHEVDKVIRRTHRTPQGELVARLDDCDGRVVASMPLPPPGQDPQRFTLEHALPQLRGTHAICLQFDVPIPGPLYGLDQVSLLPTD